MFIDFSIDRGGTFTDIYAVIHKDDGSKEERILKLLSCSNEYSDATTEGIRKIIETVSGHRIIPGRPIPTKCIKSIKLGSTIATNALLEKKGIPFVLIVTKGFKDLLLIGNQQRPQLFKLSISKCPPLYDNVYELDERVILDENGEPKVEKAIEVDEVKKIISKVKESGINSIGVSLCHSIMFPEHELAVKRIAQEMGFSSVVCSHTLGSIPRYLNRTSTACLEVYLSPLIKQYLESFKKQFEDELITLPVYVMQSDGSLFPVNNNNQQPLACKMTLSGPAGGVCAVSNLEQLTISFDMGGTSTDVARIIPGEPLELQDEAILDGHFISNPQLKIDTVAAGGGSILSVNEGMLQVGPESAGAVPGPIVYGLGGNQLTVTDANFILGRVCPQYFASSIKLNLSEALSKAENMAESLRTSVEKLASDFIDIANEAMCKPIRNITEGRGQALKKHQLNSFGGASGQHCCSIATILGIDTIIIHRQCSILSAIGISKSPIQVSQTMMIESGKLEKERAQLLIQRTVDLAKSQHGLEISRVFFRFFMHYDSSDLIIPIECESADSPEVISKFIEKYKFRFGFELKSRKVLYQSVEAIAESYSQSSEILKGNNGEMKSLDISRVYFKGSWLSVPIISTDFVKDLEGPALLVDENTTIWLEPGWRASTTTHGHLQLTQLRQSISERPALNDVAWMTRFSLRFMAIAEQMGTTLKQSAISTNIKERLDFSCALFDAEGYLIANAPHIPVHLGAMQSAIQYQLRNCSCINEGDVLISNHPKAGGSHLPDITIMRPVFVDGQICFWTAARGHHADIGGTVPGSIPANSKFLWEEGACIKSLKIITASKGFDEDALREAFVTRPATFENCAGVVRFGDTVADLTAQIGATARGEQLLQELAKEYSLDVILHYISRIRENAKSAVVKFLNSRLTESQMTENECLQAEDLMDDGTVIKVKIYKEPTDEVYVIDFTGTGPCVYGNWNAPMAITISAVMYTLRCLLDKEIPLNAGVLDAIKLIIPKDSLLDPPEAVAVVGGNVLTSQRIVDILLRAFSTPCYGFAASHGCCNNLCFGRRGEFGFYETIGGGSGASHGSHGASGVHTHMTNTRITDVEIMERRYPIIIRMFSLRRGSGGDGKFRGGDGIVRVLEFKKEMQVSIASERRTHAPYGLFGGGPGARGLNLWRHRNISINLGGKAQFTASPGDRLEIHTAGGGGFQRSQ